MNPPNIDYLLHLLEQARGYLPLQAGHLQGNLRTRNPMTTILAIALVYMTLSACLNALPENAEDREPSKWRETLKCLVMAISAPPLWIFIQIAIWFDPDAIIYHHYRGWEIQRHNKDGFKFSAHKKPCGHQEAHGTILSNGTLSDIKKRIDQLEDGVE